MSLPPEIITKLLQRIEARSLVVLCGAGLSVAPPSSLMSAAQVAHHCYTKYSPTEVLPEEIHWDVGQMADHFHGQGVLQSLFIRKLVPWDRLVGDPNRGHAAVGDFLLCRAVDAVLSANFDTMIEQWCGQRKAAIRAAIDGTEASLPSPPSSTLLKFHGCMNKDIDHTLWARAQLDEAPTQERVASCKAWMSLNLTNRDILIVGFWTDWGYLNEVLTDILTTTPTASVTVIDPAATGQLEAKAPDLWALLSTRPLFDHVQAPADEALDQLRREFSKVWLRKLLMSGQDAFEHEKGACPSSLLQPPDLSTDDLYAMRQDAEGAGSGKAGRMFAPSNASEQTALAHLLMSHTTNDRVGSWYKIADVTVRVVGGEGRGVSSVASEFVAAPGAPESDVVICAGGFHQGVPGRIIEQGRGASVVRPSPGGASRWVTLDEARAEFAI